jgi:hypothetical protein
MELVGFNARQIEEGLTHRGDAQRKTKKKQGPLTPQCLADTISKLSREQMESLFNHMVQALVGWGLLDGERLAALDGSKLPTPPTSKGRGRAQTEQDRQGQRAEGASHPGILCVGVESVAAH